MWIVCVCLKERVCECVCMCAAGPPTMHHLGELPMYVSCGGMCLRECVYECVGGPWGLCVWVRERVCVCVDGSDWTGLYHVGVLGVDQRGNTRIITRACEHEIACPIAPRPGPTLSFLSLNLTPPASACSSKSRRRVSRPNVKK